MPQHKDLTGSDLHEPKGLASVTSAGFAYISNGLGSGNWKEVPVAEDGALGQVFIANGAGSGVWDKIPTAKFAAAKVSGNTTEITPPAAGTFVEWTPTWTEISSSLITVSGNSFVVPAGTFLFIATISMVGRGTGTNTYAFDFAKNGTVLGMKSRRATASTTDVGAVTVMGVATCAANDVIKLYVANETDTDNILITDVNFLCFGLSS